MLKLRATASRALAPALVASLIVVGLGTPVSAGMVTFRVPQAAVSPVVVTMPAAPNATISNAQYSSQDVWAGVLTGVATPPSGISPLQRLANLNPPNFRIHAGTDGGAPSVDLPFNAAYTSSDSITVVPWDFNHLNSLIANTIGRTSGSTMVNVRYAPDNMFGGTGPMGGNGNAPGALLDQTYGAFATYMANLVKYYNTSSPPAGAIPTRPAGVGPIKYWEIWNEPDFSSENPRIPPSLPAPTGIVLSGVNVTGGTLTAGNTYSYRIAPMAATNQDGAASGIVSIVLPTGMNAVHITWNPSINLGRVGAAYTIYGRSTIARLVVVGKNNPAGLSWTDKGTIAPSGGVGSDQSAGGPVFSPLEYKAMWDQVVPAMKAVDPTIKVVGPVTTNPISIASGSVVTSVVTTGPNDSSYLDNRDYVQVLMTSANHPDVISYHGYGGYLGNESDSVLMNAIPQIAADVTSNILPYAGSTPIWHTEANVNAGDDSTNRPALAFGAAWQGSLFTKLAPLGVSTIHQYSYSQSPTFGLITEPGSSVAGAVEGNPYLPYWVEYWIDHLFAPGAKILSVASIPTGVDVLAVANPPDFGKVKVLVVNRQVPATNTAVPIALTGATSTDTRVRVIDSTTDLVNGPSMTDLGAVPTANLQLNGYSVGLVEFDTATGPVSPTISGLTPASGPAAGGTQVTITGTNFQAGATVSFGSTAATAVVNNSTSITATAPPQAEGIVSVTVTNPGAAGTVKNNAYVYLNGAYTLDAYGGVAAAGGFPAKASGPYWSQKLARSVVLLPAGGGGFVLDAYGGLHPWSAVGGPTVVQPSNFAYFGWDIARDMVLTPGSTAAASSGYTLDGWGGIHPFGAAPPVTSAPYFGFDIAKRIVLFPDVKGGYVLDGWGGIHPFATGGNPVPAYMTTYGYWQSFNIARDFQLMPGSTETSASGYTLDGYGGIHPASTAGATTPITPTDRPYWGFDIGRAIRLAPGSTAAVPKGWILDGYGGIHEINDSPSLAPYAYWGQDLGRQLAVD